MPLVRGEVRILTKPASGQQPLQPVAVPSSQATAAGEPIKVGDALQQLDMALKMRSSAVHNRMQAFLTTFNSQFGDIAVPDAAGESETDSATTAVPTVSTPKVATVEDVLSDFEEVFLGTVLELRQSFAARWCAAACLIAGH